jgi:hypothetical protein
MLPQCDRKLGQLDEFTCIYVSEHVGAVTVGSKLHRLILWTFTYEAYSARPRHAVCLGISSRRPVSADQKGVYSRVRDILLCQRVRQRKDACNPTTAFRRSFRLALQETMDSQSSPVRINFELWVRQLEQVSEHFARMGANFLRRLLNPVASRRMTADVALRNPFLTLAFPELN